ncbi:hypothetical protein H6P81_021227 [Aristolochia fimbriata]|uniref:Uncharacterized protein n=1 Tax=Aristolochia fimbriata TaxID=158543 RepID=A0AAV7DU59_ARIFI|nr:hypothetical protein H6P81_021227 [Aristolochia fimbriata]
MGMLATNKGREVRLVKGRHLTAAAHLTGSTTRACPEHHLQRLFCPSARDALARAWQSQQRRHKGPWQESRSGGGAPDAEGHHGRRGANGLCTALAAEGQAITTELEGATSPSSAQGGRDRPFQKDLRGQTQAYPASFLTLSLCANQFPTCPQIPNVSLSHAEPIKCACSPGQTSRARLDLVCPAPSARLLLVDRPAPPRALGRGLACPHARADAHCFAKACLPPGWGGCPLRACTRLVACYAPQPWLVSLQCATAWWWGIACPCTWQFQFQLATYGIPNPKIPQPVPRWPIKAAYPCADCGDVLTAPVAPGEPYPREQNPCQVASARWACPGPTPVALVSWACSEAGENGLRPPAWPAWWDCDLVDHYLGETISHAVILISFPELTSCVSSRIVRPEYLYTCASGDAVMDWPGLQPRGGASGRTVPLVWMDLGFIAAVPKFPWCQRGVPAGGWLHIPAIPTQDDPGRPGRESLRPPSTFVRPSPPTCVLWNPGRRRGGRQAKAESGSSVTRLNYYRDTVISRVGKSRHRRIKSSVAMSGSCHKPGYPVEDAPQYQTPPDNLRRIISPRRLGTKEGQCPFRLTGISKITLKVVVFHFCRRQLTYPTPLKSFHKVGLESSSAGLLSADSAKPVPLAVVYLDRARASGNLDFQGRPPDGPGVAVLFQAAGPYTSQAEPFRGGQAVKQKDMLSSRAPPGVSDSPNVASNLASRSTNPMCMPFTWNLSLFGLQSSHLNICYYHQDLHHWWLARARGLSDTAAAASLTRGLAVALRRLIFSPYTKFRLCDDLPRRCSRDLHKFPAAAPAQARLSFGSDRYLTSSPSREDGQKASGCHSRGSANQLHGMRASAGGAKGSRVPENASVIHGATLLIHPEDGVSWRMSRRPLPRDQRSRHESAGPARRSLMQTERIAGPISTPE